MKFIDREAQYLGRRKITKVGPTDNEPLTGEAPFFVNIERAEGRIDEEGTPISAENLNKGNWRDDDSLSFRKRNDNNLPNPKEVETQIITKDNGEIWAIPPLGLGNAKELTDDRVATTTADGVMSAADKIKLDGIEASADVSKIKSVSINGTTVTPDANKNVNIVTNAAAHKSTHAIGGSDVLTPADIGAQTQTVLTTPILDFILMMPADSVCDGVGTAQQLGYPFGGDPAVAGSAFFSGTAATMFSFRVQRNGTRAILDVYQIADGQMIWAKRSYSTLNLPGNGNPTKWMLDWGVKSYQPTTTTTTTLKDICNNLDLTHDAYRLSLYLPATSTDMGATGGSIGTKLGLPLPSQLIAITVEKGGVDAQNTIEISACFRGVNKQYLKCSKGAGGNWSEWVELAHSGNAKRWQTLWEYSGTGTLGQDNTVLPIGTALVTGDVVRVTVVSDDNRHIAYGNVGWTPSNPFFIGATFMHGAGSGTAPTWLCHYGIEITSGSTNVAAKIWRGNTVQSLVTVNAVNHRILKIEKEVPI